MPKPEADPRLVEEVIFYFNEKKRLTIKNYTHRLSRADEEFFNSAALLCKQYELTAAVFVQLLYERLYDKKNFFNPSHLQGTSVEHFLKDRKSAPEGYSVEVTNATLDPADIWEHQRQLAMIYIRNGEKLEDVLLNSSLKFFAWFRILSTPNRIDAVVSKYAHIARKELNQKIIDFIKSSGLDINRIL